MKIFGIFNLEKVIFQQNKKNFIITQKEGGLSTLITRDDNRGLGQGGLVPIRLVYFF